MRSPGANAASAPPIWARCSGAAAAGAILPLGTAITVPVTTPAVAVRDTVNLWD